MRKILIGVLESIISKCIHDALMGKTEFQLHDGSPGIHPLCSLVDCFHKLAYGDADIHEDENLSILESALKKSLPQVACLIVQEFKDEFLSGCPMLEEQ